jgi:hypothetical protein
MNRCNAFSQQASSRRWFLFTALAGALAAHSTFSVAQNTVRPFPPNTERGMLVVTYPPIVQLNGKPDRLSPGARMRGQNNMLILSGSVVGQPLWVNYVRNSTGELHEVWVLTEAEAALKLPALQ